MLSHYCLLLTFSLMLTVTFAAHAQDDDSGGDIAICVVACARCHDNLGNIFDYMKCSKQCVKRLGFSIPDCYNPRSIRRFLKLDADGDW